MSHITLHRLIHNCINDKLEKADDDVKKLLMDMKLIDSDEMFNQVLENDKVKNDIYGYIEKVGGIKRARQSIRQPPPQVWNCQWKIANEILIQNTIGWVPIVFEIGRKMKCFD